MRTFGSLLVRGLIVGLFAGLLAGTFAYVMGEPHIDSAIAIEEAAGAAHTHDANGQAVPADPEEEPLVSRDGQRFGLFLATSLYGVALGGIFAVGFALLTVGLLLVLAYLVAFDQGAISQSGMYLHELMHDGRHLLGVPCH